MKRGLYFLCWSVNLVMLSCAPQKVYWKLIIMKWSGQCLHSIFIDSGYATLIMLILTWGNVTFQWMFFLPDRSYYFPQICIYGNMFELKPLSILLMLPPFLCIHSGGCRRYYVFGLSVRTPRISLTRHLENPLTDFDHMCHRCTSWGVHELIRFWTKST